VEGRNRPAVSEILWLKPYRLLFAASIQGTGTVQEKYFNKIVWALQKAPQRDKCSIKFSIGCRLYTGICPLNRRRNSSWARY
jgi:hypothetical protein